MAKANTQRIQLTATHLHEGKVHKRGAILDVSAEVADYLLAAGIAQATDDAGDADAGEDSSKDAGKD